MKRAVQFYEKTLGLSSLFKGEDWSEFQTHEHRIALYKTTEPIASKDGAVIFFLTDPIEETIKSLKSQEVKFIKELQVFQYGKLAEFLDSEGNILGLYEPPKKKR